MSVEGDTSQDMARCCVQQANRKIMAKDANEDMGTGDERKWLTWLAF
jgi:hypothetical protein